MMSLTRQAKTLTKGQIEAVLAYLTSTRHPIRNRLIFLLSVKAGLRAKEIASLKWTMVTDAEGRLTDTIQLTNDASKGNSGRVIPINRELSASLVHWMGQVERNYSNSPFVITTERSPRTSAFAVVNMFADWYRALGFTGASSHSGQRMMIIFSD